MFTQRVVASIMLSLLMTSHITFGFTPFMSNLKFTHALLSLKL
jgi:hypothetical protein